MPSVSVNRVNAGMTPGTKLSLKPIEPWLFVSIDFNENYVASVNRSVDSVDADVYCKMTQRNLRFDISVVFLLVYSASTT